MKHGEKSALPSPDYAAAGDLLRVLCVFLISWYHIWQLSWLFPNFQIGSLRISLTVPVRLGYLFVDLMLMLSGFLLYLPYANGKERSPRAFYTRRALRILPSYWLCLLVVLVFLVADPAFTDGKALFQDLIAHLTFTQNLFSVSMMRTRLNGVLWTLAVEVQFYLLLPLLAPAFRKYPAAVYAILCGIAFFSRSVIAASTDVPTILVNRLPVLLDVYANGMLAAHVYARLAAKEERRKLVALIASVLCLAALWGIWCILKRQNAINGTEEIHRGQYDHRWFLSFFGAVFVAAGSLSARPLRALFSNRVVRFLSAISYNYYIWHQWLAARLRDWRIPPYQAEFPNKVNEQPWQTRYTLLCFAAAFAVAVLMTYLVEKPCAKWGRRLLERREETPKK